jgi:hypothetical protein
VAKKSGHQKRLEALEAHGDGDGQGCITKCIGSSWTGGHGSYRKKCYEETLSPRFGKNKKKIYNINFEAATHRQRLPSASTLKTLKVKRDPRRSKKAWFIGEFDNFDNTAQRPYKHNTHHILPMTSLISEAGLTLTQLRFLMQAGYNLNDGVNTINLPCHWQIADAMKLPDHPGGHPDYNEDVAKLVSDIQDDIEELEHEYYDDDGEELKHRLERWSEDEFWVLVEYGAQMVGCGDSNRVNSAPMAAR